ncbi:FRPD1 protein, partial [Nothocercus nigrocapillus]|nr:FRPD1 protein [Nothocercus nigrocapillus]
MEDLETNLVQARKARGIEQMVAKWLHRSRSKASRGRGSVTDIPSEGSGQPAAHVKFEVTIYKDLVHHHYGFEICPDLPLTIASVTAGSTADGKLLPGDQILLINTTAVEDISIEHAADLIREAGDKLLLTVLRCTSGGPKSSFLTAEKRAKLKTNPVKVRFAEEVLVNGHTQGNSLLCMPNVLKVYLENGQTKAFRFEMSTTVKDIVLTLKEKLSIRSIAHFALALEEQYNIAKIYLLHDDELIEQVVQKRESHDCRCLFRVCFIPKDPLDLLQEDPVAFEYLYLQSCSDVLQERFAVEMKCSVALRLAALHIQERIYTCAHPQKMSLKYIEKDWGIENFISPTLLRNMRDKDIKRAISYHMKRNQVLLDPRQKHMLAAVQVRLSYLQILGDLKMYSGKTFNATLMLQDRESYIALLVGAKYGVSQIINNKLNIITSLAEFANISRLELMAESEKVSMVKIYLQDLKVMLLTLLLESNSAKDLVCLISGYYRLFVDANVSIFTWGDRKQQVHRMSAEEGYESRICSDSEDSWELDSSMEHCLDIPAPGRNGSAHHVCEEEKTEHLHSLEQDSIKPHAGGGEQSNKSDNATDSTSEASDSANTESRGYKTSGSSDSMDALEEDELEACSSSRSEFFHFYRPMVHEMNSPDKSFFPIGTSKDSSRTEARDFCFLQAPEAAEPGSEHWHSEQRRGDMGASVLETKLSERNAMGYYSLCYSTSPAGRVEKNISHSPGRTSWKDVPAQVGVLCRPDQMAEVSDLILDPPPGFGDTSSEDEFYDAADRLSPPDALAGKPYGPSAENASCILKKPRCYSLAENLMSRQTTREKHRTEKDKTYAKSQRKRRSFLKTDYTSQVTFPLTLPDSQQSCSWSFSSFLTQHPDPPSSERVKMETKVGAYTDTEAQRDTASKTLLADLMEMEPDALETKSVTDLFFPSISAIHLQVDQNGEKNSDTAGSVDNGLIPASAVHSPFQLWEETVHLPREQSRSPTKDPNIELKTGCQSEKSCEASKEPAEMMEAHCKVNSEVEFQSQEIICPSATSSCGMTLELNLLPTAGEEVCGELVLAPCEQRKGDFVSSAEKQSDIGLSEVKTRKAVSEEAFWKAHSKNHVGFPNVTQLLRDCSGTSGIITHISCLSFGVRTDLTSPNPTKERRTNPLGLLDSSETAHMASGYLEALTVRKETQTPSAVPAFEKELVSIQEPDEGKLRKYRENVGNKQSEHSQTLIHREEVTTLEKDYPLIPSLGLAFPSGPVPLGSLGKTTGDRMASNHSFLCFNDKKDEQIPPRHIMTRSLGHSTMKNTFPPQLGMDKCSCQLSYVSCFHWPEEEEEHENTTPTQSVSLGPLTTPPSTIQSLPGTPVDRHTNVTARDRAWLDPHIQALTKLKDQAQMSPADFSCFLAYIAELQEVVGKLSGNQRTHLQDRCANHSSESKSALESASQDLLSNCQELLKTEQPLKELQDALRMTFDDLVQLTVACFQVTHCHLCMQRQSELVAILTDVVDTYHHLVQLVHQLLHRQGYPSVSAKLLARQHTALKAAVFCLMQQFRVPSY